MAVFEVYISVRTRCGDGKPMRGAQICSAVRHDGQLVASLRWYRYDGAHSQDYVREGRRIGHTLKEQSCEKGGYLLINGRRWDQATRDIITCCGVDDECLQIFSQALEAELPLPAEHPVAP